MQDLASHAAEQGADQAGPAVGGHHHCRGVTLARSVADLGRGLALAYVCFRAQPVRVEPTQSGLQMLARLALEASSVKGG